MIELKLNNETDTSGVNICYELTINKDGVNNSILASNGDDQSLVDFCFIVFIVFDEGKVSGIVTCFLIILF